VGSEGELGVAWEADTEAVKVGQGCFETDGGERVGGVPEGEEELLGVDDGGMRSGLDLGDGVVELVDLDVVGGETWIEWEDEG